MLNSRDDIVIAVMGAVGSGKSTLISKLVDGRVPVGNDTQACEMTSSTQLQLDKSLQQDLHELIIYQTF